jgi:hypothetical protein
MTQTQRDATSPSGGDCVYNSTSNKWNIYTGTAWKEAGGGAGGTRLQLMSDPSFEEGVTEGTCTGCTATSETSVVLVTPTNEKSGKAAFSASAGDYKVTKTTSSQFASAQGYVRCQIKTNQSGVEFKAYVDGVNNDNAQDTVAVIGDSVWRPYEIAIVHGSTSAGWAIDADSSITGDVYFDECAVVVGEVGLDVAQAQLAGSAYIAATASCSLSRTNATYGSATTAAACPGPTISSQYVGTWQTTDADNAIFTINSLPPGRYVGMAEFQMNNATAGAVACGRITDGTTNGQGACTSDSATSASTGLIATIDVNYPDQGNRTFTIQTRASSGQANITNTANYDGIKFTLYYYPSASKVYSQTTNEGAWVSCGLTTSDFTGFGTVSNISDRCMKNGSDLLVDIRFTSGTSTATEARVNLKIGGAALTTVSGLATLSTAGIVTDTGNLAGSAYALKESSVGYMTFSVSFSSGAGLSKILGNSLVASGRSLSIQARFPINGWSQSQITGTFTNVSTVPGVTKPRKCIAKWGGTGSISSPSNCTSNPCTEYYDNCATASTAWSATGATATTWAAGTWANSTPVWCTVTSRNVAGGANLYNRSFVNDETTSSGGLVFNNLSLVGTTDTNGAGTVVCEGQAP